MDITKFRERTQHIATGSKLLTDVKKFIIHMATIKKPTTIEEYINAAPKEAQEKLRELRAILKKSGAKCYRDTEMGITCV